MAWGWRTKPRSVIKTIQWFKSFEELDGEDWNYSLKKLSRNMKPIHPIRRRYYYNTQIDSIESPIKDLSYEEYLSGEFDGEADSESNARNDLATYKFFGLGFIDSDGKIRITKSGKMIAKENFDSEIFLKLLLKMHFPALSTGYGENCSKANPVFPLKMIINLITKLEYINRFELSLALLCSDMNEFDKLLDAVKEFREKYHYQEQDKVIMGVGLYLKRKGILDFVELAKRMPEYKFIWFGYLDLKLVPKEIKMAVETKLDNLIFAGYVEQEELKKAYSSCDLYLFPTLEETEGIPILEALVERIPTLVRDIPVFEEYETNKAVYKAKTIEEFEEKIKNILEKKLPSLEEYGYQVAIQKDTKKVGKQLIEIYESLLRGAK